MVLKTLLRYADGFRTDTAQTILSTPAEAVAGHTGSRIRRDNQDAAHDLLRAKVMDLLLIDPKAKTARLTRDSLNVILASITVTSMAPGALARKVKGTSVSLKAGAEAISGWEDARNEAKRRLWEVFGNLDYDERTFVMEHARDFHDSTQQGIKGTRSLSSGLRRHRGTRTS